jgi:DNA-binding transcriptional regulator YiaG
MMSNADEIRTVEPRILVREMRQRLGLTQERFAALLGVTLPTINRWENGRSKPSPLALKNLRELLVTLQKEVLQFPSDNRKASECKEKT